MSSQSNIRTRIQKAEDLPTILPTPSNWNSLEECHRSIFRSLDISTVAVRRVNLIPAMDSEVDSIISDALRKGILVNNQDGSIAIQSRN
jgi:hypothetical protein